MRYKAVSEKSAFSVFGKIEKLVNYNHIPGFNLFFKASYRADRNYFFDPGNLQCIDICGIIYFGGQYFMPFAASRIS